MPNWHAIAKFLKKIESKSLKSRTFTTLYVFYKVVTNKRYIDLE